MNFLPHLGYEISEAQVVIHFIFNTIINVIIMKNVYFYKALPQNKLNKSLETSNQYTFKIF